MTKIRKKNVNCNPPRDRRNILTAIFYDNKVAGTAQRLAALLLVEPARPPKLSLRYLADHAALSEHEVQQAIRQLSRRGHLKAIAACWPPEQLEVA